MIGVVLLSYWWTTSSLQKGYLEFGSSHTLAHLLILEKPLKTYLTRTERSQTDLAPTIMSLTLSNPPGSETKNSRDPIRSPQNHPQSPKQIKPKKKPRHFPSGPAVETRRFRCGCVVSFRGLGTEIQRASLLGQKQNQAKIHSMDHSATVEASLVHRAFS